MHMPKNTPQPNYIQERILRKLILCPLRIGERHPQNEVVSVPLTNGACDCDCLLQGFYPGSDNTKELDQW